MSPGVTASAFAEELVEGGPCLVGRLEGCLPLQVEGDEGLEELAVVALGLRGDRSGNGFAALIGRRRVEVAALDARVQRRAALSTRRLGREVGRGPLAAGLAPEDLITSPLGAATLGSAD